MAPLNDARLLERMRRARRLQYDALDRAWNDAPDAVWDTLYGFAERERSAWTGETVSHYVESRIDVAPGRALSCLLRIAITAEPIREEILGRFLRHWDRHPAEGLRAAANVLKTGPRFHDARLITGARERYALDPESAWWVFTYAGRVAPRLLTDALLDWIDPRHPAGGEHWFEILAGRALDDGPRAAWALTRYHDTFASHPAGAIAAAAGNLAGEPGDAPAAILVEVRRHFDAHPEKAWEFFERTARGRAELMTPDVLEFLVEKISSAPASLFKIFHQTARHDPTREAELIRRYARLLPLHPAEGIDAAYYLAHNDTRLLRQELVDAACDHFPASAYHAFDILRTALRERPEMVRERHVVAAVDAIPHATNWAFGFFREILERRPEFKPLAVLALFECLGREPVNRAQNRAEMVQSIATIAGASHVETELARLLREPPRAGSRRARALMAIMFRQTSHSKQHVLFEALRFTATACTWSEHNWTPLWDFLMFLIDHSSDDSVSTAAAERYLEGAYQLHYLMERGSDHDAFRNKFDLRRPAEASWPEGARFLESDRDLGAFRDVLRSIADRLEETVRLRPLEAFADRFRAAEREREALEKRIAGSDAGVRERLEKRSATLDRIAAAGRDADYRRALDGDGAARERLPEELSRLLDRERRDLVKHVRDALRSELERVAVGAIERSRLGLYQAKLKSVLDRDVDIRTVDSTILPVFLFFPSLERFPRNRKWLARLLEDRIDGKPHDWLWSEPPAAAWAERVREATPGIRLDRWRVPYSRAFDYRPADAEAERKRRIRADLAQTREILERAGATGFAKGDVAELTEKLRELRTPPEASEEPAPPPPDPELLEEAAMNLERVRIEQETPDSDFKGRLTFEVETDPIQVLFMGEYGFASCLSLRGMNVWSAVSNAIDVDKAIVWAKEPGGNVVGRRLLALLPEGLLSFRTYTNRHGLALDPLFGAFVEDLAARLNTRVVHRGKPGPLLSDQWYDDGAV